MFKSFNTRLIENLEKQIEKQSARIRDLERTESTKVNSIATLQQQAGCGIEHETERDITDSAPYPWLEREHFETCTICGKVLRKFDTKLEADEREAEILQDVADKAKRAVREAKAKNKEA